MPDTLIIKSKIGLKPEDYKKLYTSLMVQKENRLLVVPNYCEVIVVPNDIEIKMQNVDESSGLLIDSSKF